MGSSEDLKDYLEHDCKSSTITGELVDLYANIQDLADPESLSAVTTCRDVENYSESLLECAVSFLLVCQPASLPAGLSSTL